jgi:hypothetical protein
VSYAHVLPKYRPSTSSALILAPDTLAAALVAAAVELAGIPPVFAQSDEPGKTALLRCRPRYVLLSDDEPSARDESFLGPALMTGARLFVFGTRDRVASLQPVMARHGVESIVIPRDLDDLRAILTGESESSRRRPPTTAP